MKKIKRCIRRLLTNPKSIVEYYFRNTLGKLLSDDIYLRMVYRVKMHENLDLENPKTYNEKLQWLKLYNRKPEYTMMVDKYKVRDYIAEKLGEEYLIPLLGVWDQFEDIDFDKLPNQFVLKTNHDSGGIVICKDKKEFDINYARTKLNRSLKRNYYYAGREWPYKNVPKKIVCEKYMVDESGYELKDYKFLCFNGKVRSTLVCSERNSGKGLHVTFFDKEWNIMPFERHDPHEKDGVEKPQNYKTMIEIAENLSMDIPFVRVDFYEINNKIYFGELTFYPGGGFKEFTPKEWDYTLGSWIELPNV